MKVRPSLRFRQATITLVAFSFVALCAGAMMPQETLSVTFNQAVWVRSPNIGTSLLAKESPTSLPASIVTALRQDLSKRTGIQPQAIQVKEAAQRTWSDGCLGLAKADEMCTQALVNGWRVVLSHGSRRWVYRTNSSGKVVRLEATTQI